MSLSRALKAIYPDIDFTPDIGDCELVDKADGLGPKIERWDRVELQPDEAILLAEYDPLPDAKTDKQAGIEAEAVRRMRLINGAVESRAVYDLLEAVVQTITPTAREPLPALLADLKAVRDAAATMISEVNALTTVESVQTYDVETNPAWPA